MITTRLVEYGRRDPSAIAVRGAGSCVWDRAGRRYLDAVSGIHVANIGHGVPSVARAVGEQLERLAFVNKRQFVTEEEERLGNLVADLVGWPDKILFVSSGSEANEAAFMVAQAYHAVRGNARKTRVISRWHAYHGNTSATLAAGGHLAFRDRCLRVGFDWPHIDAPYCYRCPYKLNQPVCDLRCADELERAITNEGAETIAAFIAEPIMGTTGGAIVPPDGYYQRVRSICDKFDVLLIADEVITAFGRSGSATALSAWHVQPDIMTGGKGLACGYAPICAVMLGQKVWRVVAQRPGGVIVPRATFGGNAGACAAALAVQDYIRENGLVERCRLVGESLKAELQTMAARVAAVGDVRGRGLLLALEIVQDKKSRAPFPRRQQIQERVVRRALELGVILVGGTGTGPARDGDHIMVSPPFVIGEEDCHVIVNALEEAIVECTE